VSHPEDEKLNVPDFELPGEHPAPQEGMAQAMEPGGPPAEGEPAFEMVPGGQLPSEELLGGLGEPGVVPLEPAPAEEGEPSAAGEPTEVAEFGGEEPGAEEEPSKKKKKKGKISKTGDSEEGEEKGESIWQRLAKASPYTMMLWISLLGLIVGTVFLYLELRTYKFDLKAREAKQRVGAVAAPHSGPARTNAVA
jgi:hypothetical protein